MLILFLTVLYVWHNACFFNLYLKTLKSATFFRLYWQSDLYNINIERESYLFCLSTGIQNISFDYMAFTVIGKVGIR